MTGSSKGPILLLVSSCYCFWARDIVVSGTVLLKGIKAIYVRPYERGSPTLKIVLNFPFKIYYLREVYEVLVRDGTIVPKPEKNPPTVPMDYSWAQVSEELKFRGWYDAVFRLGQETHEILFEFQQTSFRVVVPFPKSLGTSDLSTSTTFQFLFSGSTLSQHRPISSHELPSLPKHQHVERGL